jgi:heavy metal sensor kinase
MWRSFKIKIGLLSVCLSGLLLLAFSLFFIQTSYRIGLDRTDRELRALVDSEMRKVQPENHWARFDESLKSLYGDPAEKQVLLQVSDRQKQILFESPQWPKEIQINTLPSPPEAPPVPPEKMHGAKRRLNDRTPPTVLTIGTPEYVTVGNWRIMAVCNADITMHLALSLVHLNAEIMRFQNALLLTVPVALLLMIAGGWLLSQLALRPVNRIARTADGVTAFHLDERIPTDKADHEFKQLIEVINRMLGRLETSFQQAVRFSADAAHELKTPLTILQGQLEAALQTAPDLSADQKTYKEALDEVQRLKSIIRKLLLLAQADSGHLPLKIEPLDFSRMIHNVCDDIGLLAPELKIEADIQPAVTVQADAELIEQVIQNLAGNAVKFSRGESPIRLSLTRRGRGIEFTILNHGQTIPAEDRDKIFERFYRTDKAHSRKTDGTGLGLSLAREIALAHNGTLELVDSEDGTTTFQLVLPQRAP